MGIQEDIFRVFFKKLEEDENFPDSILEELKILWENDEMGLQEKILEAIKRGCENVSKD